MELGGSRVVTAAADPGLILNHCESGFTAVESVPTWQWLQLSVAWLA